MATPASLLRAVGAYGFDRVAPLILAALVTEDPLLLIGASGTGKSFLLNSLSEALQLEHRHYNASLVSFDDLVGFPFPDEEKRGVHFLETPATIWGAESVLVDEISRCKPEHQNRLFSLIHERRVQGIALDGLRFRWAAMNPCTTDQDGGGGYLGSEALDQALGDRFGLFISVVDWNDLGDEDRRRIAHPAGEGALAPSDSGLVEALALWKAEFERRLPACPSGIVTYAVAATSALNGAGIRVSPRRARFLARSLLALSVIEGEESISLFRFALEASMPHVTWGQTIAATALDAAHKLAWDAGFLVGERRWVHRFHAEPALARKLRLLAGAPSLDAASQAIAEFIGNEKPERVAALASALYPAALAGLEILGAEGANDLGKIAMRVFAVAGEISWSEPYAAKADAHPEYARTQAFIAGIKNEARRARASQLFTYLLVAGIRIADPSALESEYETCVSASRDLLRRRRARKAVAREEESTGAHP